MDSAELNRGYARWNRGTRVTGASRRFDVQGGRLCAGIIPAAQGTRTPSCEVCPRARDHSMMLLPHSARSSRWLANSIKLTPPCSTARVPMTLTALRRSNAGYMVSMEETMDRRALLLAMMLVASFAGCSGDLPGSGKELMNAYDPAPWNRVMAYADAISLPDRDCSYGDVGNALAAEHPLGYSRCYAVWWSDADITNGGFKQYFHNSTGDLVLLAIECFEHVKQDRMAAIFKYSNPRCSFANGNIPNTFDIELQRVTSRISPLFPMISVN